jgi:hypothetical protein
MTDIDLTYDDYIKAYEDISYRDQSILLNKHAEVNALQIKYENELRDLMQMDPADPNYERMVRRVDSSKNRYQAALDDSSNAHAAYNWHEDNAVELGNKFLPNEGETILAHEVSHTNPQVRAFVKDQLDTTGQINYTEENPILLDFRNEDGIGFYWVNLETKNSTEECKRMGHCGTSHYGILYSLRETKKLPGTKYTINNSISTAAIGGDNILYQLKGPKNSKPKEEFHQYILPLFYVEEDGEYLIQGFGSEYRSDQDFKLSDLPNNVLIDLYKNRPELFGTFSPISLQKKLVELGVIEKPV